MDKNEIRQALMRKRALVTEREDKDAAIAAKVCALAEKYSSVFVYVSMRSEVSTYAIIERLKKTHTVYIPHTVKSEMHAVKYDGSPLIPDRYGNIYESAAEFCDGQAELNIVPLIGFNENCHRIGYGKGCYDIYFSKYIGGPKIGLGYDEQLCDFLPDVTDVPLDEIITPTKTLRRSK